VDAVDHVLQVDALVIRTELRNRPAKGVRPDDWRALVPMRSEAYSAEQIDALRAGDLVTCFGPEFARLQIEDPLTIPGGAMRLLDRVTSLEPDGGQYGLGFIRAEADIHPDDWFIVCHFVDDRVMPGTLMYECCLHTLRVYLLRMGWVGARDEVVCQPVIGAGGRLRCRGQVLETTRVATYEVTVKELGYGPEPYAIVDAMMYSDGKPIVEIEGMSLRMTGLTRDGLEARWAGAPRTEPAPLFTREQILAYAIGNPSECFGPEYRVFDTERILARLPGPPFLFLDRIVAVDHPAWSMTAGGRIVGEYDVPADAWYFTENRQPLMPFVVLLEIALQPCGWFAAYMGSALTSDVDISFRNLGGKGVLHRAVDAASGTLRIEVRCTGVSASGGMIIQNYDFAVHDAHGPIYTGDTYFGFFSKDALANQVGLRELEPHEPGETLRASVAPISYPDRAPYPGEKLRMIDTVTCYLPEGGPHALGFIEGETAVRPDAWFFDAHFYQDPVIPGSLGLESLFQLMKLFAVRRWGEDLVFESPATEEGHEWVYRGQVIPSDTRVTVQLVVTHIDDATSTIRGDGLLIVDGRKIYQMKRFTLRCPRAV